MPKQKTQTPIRKSKKEAGGKKKKGKHIPRYPFVMHLPEGHSLTRNALDPNAPKRGLSAYMFFANEQRENVREENPGIAFGMS